MALAAVGRPARADSTRWASSTRGRRSRQSRPVASASFSASTAATSSWSRLRTCAVRFRRWSSGARSASRSQRRMRSTRVARNGGHDRARWPASSAVSTGGSWVPVAVPISASSAAAWASQADRLRDLQSSQPPISATTRRMSSAQPRAPSPSDSAAAGVPASEDVGVDVGARVSADVAGAVVGELGGSSVVGGWADVGVSAVVRGGRVESVVVSLDDSVPPVDSVLLGAGRVPERSTVVRVAESLPPPASHPVSPRARLSTSPARSHALLLGAGDPVPAGPGRGHDPPRQHPRHPHRRPPPDRPGQEGEARPAYDAAILWPADPLGITRSG